MSDVEMVTLIRTRLATRGVGTKDDPMRVITQYWTPEGELVVEVDPVLSRSEPYAVGYRKPPEHTKFKPGQSGNPGGRPRRGSHAEP